MKWRVKNLTTGNFTTKAIDWAMADKVCSQLNQFGEKFKAVQVETESEKLTDEPQPMSQDVRKAITVLPNIKYPSQTNHADFANMLIHRFSAKKLEISEKEEAYLWYIVHRYRRQIDDMKLIQAALQNKVY